MSIAIMSVKCGRANVASSSKNGLGDSGVVSRSGSDEELGDEVGVEHELVAQVDHAAGEVTFEVVEDQPCVGCRGFGSDEGPRIGELAGCSSQPLADLVGAAVFAALVDDRPARCEGRQCNLGVVPVMGVLVPADDFGKFEAVVAQAGGVGGSLRDRG